MFSDFCFLLTDFLTKTMHMLKRRSRLTTAFQPKNPRKREREKRREARGDAGGEVMMTTMMRRRKRKRKNFGQRRTVSPSKL